MNVNLLLDFSSPSLLKGIGLIIGSLTILYKKISTGSTLKADALQDLMSQEGADIKGDTNIFSSAPLQDICSVQPALLIGPIASLTGSTLQDDIAQTTRRFIISGKTFWDVFLKN